jgi:metal-dependent amidase/aminoacylase/carboxypeptidase family protein
MLEKSLEGELIEFRRNLHQFPESSNKEFETTIKIKKKSIKYGVEE